MNRTGRYAGALMTTSALVMAITGCTAAADDDGGEGEGDDGKASASCVAQFTYRDRTYRNVANVDYAVGARLGTATQPPCNDTGRRAKVEEPATKGTAYEVAGLSPEVAIAIGGTPAETTLFVAYSGSVLPPEVRQLINRASATPRTGQPS